MVVGGGIVVVRDAVDVVVSIDGVTGAAVDESRWQERFKGSVGSDDGFDADGRQLRMRKELVSAEAGGGGGGGQMRRRLGGQDGRRQQRVDEARINADDAAAENPAAENADADAHRRLLRRTSRLLLLRNEHAHRLIRDEID